MIILTRAPRVGVVVAVMHMLSPHVFPQSRGFVVEIGDAFIKLRHACDTLQEEEEEEDAVLEEKNDGQLKLQSPHAIPALQNSLRDLRTREEPKGTTENKLQRGEPSGAAAVFVFAKFGKCSPNFDVKNMISNMISTLMEKNDPDSHAMFFFFFLTKKI